ncbi:hypothetical protein LCGC14_3074960 [marine sediment metagenome]|uniref:Uncharacterized protein n=1 Tax=marine sediment metagenome TaxID=412755 RepID=A0A0F8Z5Q7_9ZZZZ
MKNRTKFNWKCVCCGKRNIEAWRFQFDVPKCYTVEVTCQKCGKTSIIEFRLAVEAAVSVAGK